MQQIVRSERFRVNLAKRRVIRNSQRQVTAGVVVNEKLNVARDDYDRLKAILHNCRRHGPAAQNRERHPEFAAHLRGRIAHVAQLNPLRARSCWGSSSRLIGRDKPDGNRVFPRAALHKFASLLPGAMHRLAVICRRLTTSKRGATMQGLVLDETDRVRSSIGYSCSSFQICRIGSTAFEVHHIGIAAASHTMTVACVFVIPLSLT